MTIKGVGIPHLTRALASGRYLSLDNSHVGCSFEGRVSWFAAEESIYTHSIQS